MRHAEAADARADKSRPLTSAGRLQAVKTANFFNQLGINIDTIISSDAQRIIETRNELKETLLNVPEILTDSRLYGYPYSPTYGLTDDLMLNFLQRLLWQHQVEEKRAVMVLGHNPDIQKLAEHLSGGLPKEMMQSYPSSTACIFATTALKWDQVSPHNSYLTHVFLNGERIIEVNPDERHGPPGFPSPFPV